MRSDRATVRRRSERKELADSQGHFAGRSQRRQAWRGACASASRRPTIRQTSLASSRRISCDARQSIRRRNQTIQTRIRRRHISVTRIPNNNLLAAIPEVTARRRINTNLGRCEVVQEVADHGIARSTWHISTQPWHCGGHLVGVRSTLRMDAEERTRLRIQLGSRTRRTMASALHSR